jgi:HlyD family secretion protein
MTAVSSTGTNRSIRRHLLIGTAAVFVLTGGIGGWAATTDISGALIAPGSIVVDSNVKKVQHPSGGVVGQLLVHEGSRVSAGDVVVRLDETVQKAGLAIVAKGLDEFSARKARLESERDGAAKVGFPPDLMDRASEAELGRVLAAEQRLFELRHTARSGQKLQLGQRIVQLREEISGLAAQQDAKVSEIVLIKRELEGVRGLWEKNLVEVTRLIALEREATRLEGERAQLTATMSQARGKIAETELQIIQIDQDLASEVAKEMREIDGRIGEFVERKIAAEDQLKRIDIRAPQDGFVHQLAVHTVGGVIPAGEPLMLIVPTADRLTVEARVAPQDIDQLRIGQAAALRFSAFSQRTTPEINGALSRVSADVTTDQRSGASYYTVRIDIDAAEMARLGNVRLVPGMPVEAFIKTGDRTVGSYLVKPLHDQVMRAFRER